MNHTISGSLPIGSLSILTILFCAYFVLRSCDICFVSEWWNVVTNAVCLTIPLIGTCLVMGAYTTWQQKALACLFLFPIVLLCTGVFCIYSPAWTKVIVSPGTVPAPIKSVMHNGDNFVVYKNAPPSPGGSSDGSKGSYNNRGKIEVDEERVMWIFKLKRFVAGASNVENVAIDFPTEDRVSCTFSPGNRKFIEGTHGSIGSGILETMGFRRK